MIRLLAYAKLNLSLRVLGRRQDGFHEIDSLIQTIDLADTISVEMTQSGVTVENNYGIPSGEDLAGRAVQLLLAEKRDPRGARITVEKQIPVGAGLGGGSSDAAATLWALNQLTPPPLPSGHMLHLATHLGSDVPLFLTGGRMRVSGKGEKIIPLPSNLQEHFLLLIPPVHCDTASVYAHFDRLTPSTGQALTEAPLGRNDLEAAALHLYPALVPYREAVDSLSGLYFGMSGSGATFFAVFSDVKAAKASQKELSVSFPDAKIHLCPPTQTGYCVERRH